MGAPQLDEELCKQAVTVRSQHKSTRAAAKAMGIPESTLRKRLKLAAQRGYAPESGLDHPIPEGYQMKGYSVYTRDINDNPIWIKTEAVRQYWSDTIATAIESRDPKPIIIPPPRLVGFDSKDIIPWLNIGDAHIGMLAHEAEIGQNFDLKLAKAEIIQASFDLMDMAPDCERMVINDLGDGTHYENMKGWTERSGHQLDYDTRFPKMIDTYLDVMEAMIEKALTKAETVDVIINQGNHSETNDYWAAQYFRRLYSRVGGNRVNVLANESPFIAYRMGKTLVLVHHGHKVKPETLRQVMSSDFAIDWGETIFRYIDGGHVHHFSAKELGGAEWCSFNNLAASDKHAHDGGWRSKQAMTLVLRSRTYGDLGRYKMPIEKVWDELKKKDPHHYVPAPKRAFSA